jgi:hypothetical protein
MAFTIESQLVRFLRLGAGVQIGPQRRADRAAALAAAAVFGQVADQCIHRRNIRRIKYLPARARGDQQPGAGQLLQMKRQRGRRDIESLADVAHAQAFRRMRYQ